MSLDALRGFDMFWIIGADELVERARSHGPCQRQCDGRILGLRGRRNWSTCEWEGFHFEDLIFPLFVFMAGISIVFSLGKTIRQEGRAAAVKRVCRRGILLFVIGLFYSGGLTNPWPDMRLMGVLNRIALCYFFAGLIFCFFNLRAMIAIGVAALVGYWALLTFVPIRNIQLQNGGAARTWRAKRNVPFDPKALFYSTTERVTGHYEPGFNLTNQIDFEYLPGRLYDTYFDPEGLLEHAAGGGDVPAGRFCGVVSAQRLVQRPAKGDLPAGRRDWCWRRWAGPGARNFRSLRKFGRRHSFWSREVTARLLLGVFYWIVDVCKWQNWCQPFVWMGMNSITIYMTENILGRVRQIEPSGLPAGTFTSSWSGSMERQRRSGAGAGGIVPGLLVRAFPLPKENLHPAVRTAPIALFSKTSRPWRRL